LSFILTATFNFQAAVKEKIQEKKSVTLYSNLLLKAFLVHEKEPLK